MISVLSHTMAHPRVVVLLVFSIFCISESKVFTRCELTRELLKNNFQRTFLSNWVCLVEQVSERNTAAYNERTLKKYYGLFQIGNEWCKEGKKGGKCNIACESLLDEDIRDDCVCATKIFDQEGFKYWKKWEQRCKGHTLPDIEKCPDFINPPSPRASPPRNRREVKSAKMLRSNHREERK